MKDTNNLKNKLGKIDSLPEGSLKVNVNVIPLCTKILDQEGIKAVGQAYDSNNNCFISNLDFKIGYVYFQR